MNATSLLCDEERTLLVPNSSPTVFVVDDDISVRESLEFLIQDEGWHVETFKSAEEFLNRPRQFIPSCLILDILMPGLNGLELQRRLAVERPDMPIIFLTGNADIPMTVQAMKGGAVEFLTKPFSDGTLLSVVSKAVSRSTALIARDAELRALRARYARLSSREREVMALVVAGKANKEVGTELGISEITVKAHRGSMMRKMEADSLAELVNQAARLRLSRPTRKLSNTVISYVPLRKSFNRSRRSVTLSQRLKSRSASGLPNRF
jgi:FixJ family two-component response regulator